MTFEEFTEDILDRLELRFQEAKTSRKAKRPETRKLKEEKEKKIKEKRKKENKRK
eukprot:TRINITY_DN6072_c0_g1_i1.p4 TRINITY_DN6072_c0_g1~~TRINITY_DN6072_c0_g1_i1.p4  ORF type:complete len:55 (-),score=17.41 TRINITY_DN6072_c0_g1_i1:140-304(-)